MFYNTLNIIKERPDFFLSLISQHIRISFISLISAFLIGGLIGIIISEYKITSKPILSLVNFIYTIPSISLLGFLIPLSGIGNTTAIIALTLYALLPMVRNTYTGITNIDEHILEAAKGLGSTPFQILTKIKIPLALPVIMSGIRNMTIMTIALAGIASFIGAGGLGVAIYRGITTNNTALTLAGSLLIALLAIFTDLILGFIEKRINSKTERKKLNFLFKLVPVFLIVVLLIGVFRKNKVEKTVNIATKPMTEQYIIGEMLKILFEEDGFKVNLTAGVGGGTSNIQQGMEKGNFDIYPEYTGTAWNSVLKKDSFYQEALFSQMEKEYTEKYNMSWRGFYGFNNTYGIAVKKEIADKHNLKTYSDLAKISNELTFGAEYDFFEREDGYKPLVEKYGFKFKNIKDMDIGLKYQAINGGNIDVMNIFTTDGQLSTSNIVVLEDDKKFYPSYLCGNVVRNEFLEKNPSAKDILNKLNNIIDDKTMSEMNYQVEGNNMEPKEVAKVFLKSKGLIKR